jgi:hypothetical protein
MRRRHWCSGRRLIAREFTCFHTDAASGATSAFAAMKDLIQYFDIAFGGLVGALVAVAAMTWLSHRVAYSAKTVKSGSVLEYGNHLKIVAAALCVLCIGGCVAVAFAPADQRLAAFGLVIAFCIACGALALEIFFVSIHFDEIEIKTRSPWRRARSIPWESVEEATYSPSMKWFKVKTRGYGSIRLPILLSGAHDFLAALQARGISVAGVHNLAQRSGTATNSGRRR